MARESRRVKRSGRVNSYGRPQPVRQRRQRAEIKLNLRATLSLVALLVAGIWWWRTFSVQAISVAGTKFYPASTITKSVQGQLHSHWWWRNLVLVDTSKLQKAVLLEQPQLANLAISRHWPHQLRLRVSERKPNLKWQTGGQIYLLSQEGIIVAPAQGVEIALPTVEDTTNLPVRLGDQAVSAHFVDFCLEAIRLLPGQGVQVSKLKIPVTTTEVDIYTAKGFYIKFDTTRSASGEVGDLGKVLNLLKSQNKQPAEYIDLRIDGAAYYK